MPRHNEWVTASELFKREMNQLRGQLCSAIEAMNLPEKQERGTITLMKQLSYNTQAVGAQLLEEALPNRVFKYNDKKVEARLNVQEKPFVPERIDEEPFTRESYDE